ncbi:MAG: alpha/beta hydrolase [Actinobacteria bacterium]|nr:alpha/beta hydrolase [Actinomycetota bacterium]
MPSDPTPVRWVVGDGGVRLAVRSWPGGDPGALLLHGLASSSHIWDLVAPRLSNADLRAMAYDQRGHGLSGKPSSGYGFDRATADARAVVGATRLRRPVVVGHSWGANVTLELAVRAPRTVLGAVLLDGGFLSLSDRFDWPTAREVLAPPPLAGMPLSEFLEGARRWLRGSVDVTPDIEEVIRSFVRVDVQGRIRPRLNRTNHLRILHALWDQDTMSLLRRVRVPTLVLAVRSAPGTADSAGFMDEKRRAAREVRAIGDPVRFEWIDGIHDVPLQRPEALARRIVRFSRTLVPPGRS